MLQRHGKFRVRDVTTKRRNIAGVDNFDATTMGKSIGAILIDAGKLTAEQAEQTLRLQKADGLRFGDAAIKLGFIVEADISFAISKQFDYPVVVPGQSKLAAELIAAYQPHSTQVEALRALRSQLMLRWFGSEPERHALAVVSPGSGEGRSYLAANLAVVFSQLGEHTLLIDADMRNPRQHHLFGLDNRVGLSAVLSGRGDAEAIQRITELMDLSVMPAGMTPPNPQELLSKPFFSNLLEELVNEFDIVIIDTPPASEFADAHTVAVRAGAALMLAKTNTTRMRKMRELMDVLNRASAHVVGMVLNES